jgi:hypothetical protein
MSAAMPARWPGAARLLDGETVYRDPQSGL